MGKDKIIKLFKSIMTAKNKIDDENDRVDKTFIPVYFYTVLFIFNALFITGYKQFFFFFKIF